MDSSESLLDVLDNTPHVVPHAIHYDRVVGPPRVRGERGRGSETGEGVRGTIQREEKKQEEREEEREEEGEGRGFEYTTTANIARHLRSETRRGMPAWGHSLYNQCFHGHIPH